MRHFAHKMAREEWIQLDELLSWLTGAGMFHTDCEAHHLIHQQLALRPALAAPLTYIRRVHIMP